jgi:molecular chaperone HscB
VICWSCQKAAGIEALCGSCGAILPPDRSRDYFQVLGVKHVYALDLVDLEQRYKNLTKTLHPDRYAKAAPEARRASLERSVQLNEAWRTLSDPIRRAEYLLSLKGIVVGEQSQSNAAASAASHATLPVPPSLLMEVMELREALVEARDTKDLKEVDALIAKVQTRLDQVYAEVAGGFAQERPDYPTLAARLVSVRYYRRFLDEAQSQRNASLLAMKEPDLAR